MKMFSRVVAIIAMLCLCLTAMPAEAAKKQNRIGDVRSSSAAPKVRVDKGNGKKVWRKVTPRTKVVLVTKNGKREKTTINAVGRGAQVLKTRQKGKRITKLVLRAKGATGTADCSFDSDEDDYDKVDGDSDFTCSNDYDDGKVETDSDCSYESESESDAEESAMEVSWDCSYSEDNTKDREDALEWDCSFDAESSSASEAGESEFEAELGFDCSWENAETDSALWNCRFLTSELGFLCSSEQLDQQFGYTIDVVNQTIVGGLDFQSDLVEEDSGDGDVSCSRAGGGMYDCSYDAEIESGDCEVEWDFDRSRGVRDGDVSGSLSYACASESEGGSDEL